MNNAPLGRLLGIVEHAAQALGYDLPERLVLAAPDGELVRRVFAGKESGTTLLSSDRDVDRVLGELADGKSAGFVDTGVDLRATESTCAVSAGAALDGATERLRKAGEILAARGGGRIVVLTRLVSNSDDPHLGNLAALEGARRTLARGLRRQLKGTGVEVSNVVCGGMPGMEVGVSAAARAVRLALRLGIDEIVIPPGSDALAALAAKLPPPLDTGLGALFEASREAWAMSPEATLDGPAGEPENNASVATKKGGKSSDGATPVSDDKEPPASNAKAVRGAAARAAAASRSLASKRRSKA